MDLRVAAYGVITDDDGRMLLAHWRDGSHQAWTLPGGGLEDGEDPEDALRREVLEETGYIAKVGGILGVRSRVIPAARRITGTDQPLHTLGIVYRAHVVGGDLRNEIDGSTDEARWFSPAELIGIQRAQVVELARGWAGLSEIPR